MDSIPCDVCGKAIVDYEHDLYHFSGMLNDKSCNHIHVCKTCFDNCNQDLYIERKTARSLVVRM